jgi:probable phosphoglycerate mutase
MTTFLLIRHGSIDLLGRTLAGRAPDVHLNARGKVEAERLAERLAHIPVRAIYTSPMERAQETAWPLAARFGLDLRISAGLDEIDFGAWTRRSFSELDPQPEWQRWNAARSEARAPGGESMGEVQARVVAEIESLAPLHGNEAVALISHGDVIKAALMHTLGVPLDHILRFEISPASVSVLLHRPDGAQVALVNDTGEFSLPREGARFPHRAAA